MTSQYKKRKFRSSTSTKFGAPKRLAKLKKHSQISDILKMPLLPENVNLPYSSVPISVPQGSQAAPPAPSQPVASGGRQQAAAPVMTADDLTQWYIQASQNPTVIQHLKAAAFQEYGKAILVNDSRITELEEHYTKLAIDLEQQEQYSRRNAIHISNCNWPEETAGEDTDRMVLDIIHNVLKISSITESDISISHRVGNRERGPRPILVKFVRYRMKEKVMKEKKNLPDGIHINEDLSPYISSLAYEARQLKRQGAVAETWVYDGRIYVKPTARDRGMVVSSIDELMDIVPEPCSLVTFADAALPWARANLPSQPPVSHGTVSRMSSPPGSSVVIQHRAQIRMTRSLSRDPRMQHTSAESMPDTTASDGATRPTKAATPSRRGGAGSNGLPSQHLPHQWCRGSCLSRTVRRSMSWHSTTPRCPQ